MKRLKKKREKCKEQEKRKRKSHWKKKKDDTVKRENEERYYKIGKKRERVIESKRKRNLAQLGPARLNCSIGEKPREPAFSWWSVSRSSEESNGVSMRCGLKSVVSYNGTGIWRLEDGVPSEGGRNRRKMAANKGGIFVGQMSKIGEDGKVKGNVKK